MNSAEVAHILIEDSVRDHAMTSLALEAQVKARFSTPQISTIADKDSAAIEKVVASQGTDPYLAGKKVLVLRNARGQQFRTCPGAQTKEDGKRMVCCNYYVFNFLSGCPFNCTYCYLGTYLNQYALSMQVNLEEPLAELFTHFRTYPKQFFRMGTGEIADSLGLPAALPLNRYLISEFAGHENALLELKTKSAAIDGLLDLDSRGHTVISWSLSPPSISQREEEGTATPTARLAAAKKAFESGFRVAFHLDPLMFMHPDWASWEKDYGDLLEAIFATIPPSGISWISLGGLRLMKGLREKMLDRFPKSKLPYQEFALGEDGKWRYLKPIRKHMFQFLSKRIAEGAGTDEAPPVYLCMESREVWDRALGGIPETQGKLRPIFSHVAPQNLDSRPRAIELTK